MEKEILQKWDNTCIEVLSEEHGKELIKFWQSVGVDTVNRFGDAFNGDCPSYYYGIFSGIFNLIN